MGTIQIGLWNVDEEKLLKYLSSIENDITSGSYYKFSDRAMIHAELFESLELADTNRENYKLLLKLAKGTLKVKIPRMKRSRHGLRSYTIQQDLIERLPPVIHFEVCRNCDGTKKCWCQTAVGKKEVQNSGKCYTCKGDGVCGQCNEKGMSQVTTYSSDAMIKHQPDNWTASRLSKKQMKLLKDNGFQHNVILSLMHDFAIGLDIWIDKQIEKSKGGVSLARWRRVGQEVGLG